MKKNTPLYILLVVLLLVNGFFLFKHFGDKPDYRGKEYKGSKNFIVRQLDFNESQLQQYQVLKSSHRKAMNGYDDDIRILKDKFYSNLSDENIKTLVIDSIATLISEKEKLKDIAVFNHFSDVRRICNEDQKERFSSIIKNAIYKRGRKGSDSMRRKGQGPPKGN